MKKKLISGLVIHQKVKTKKVKGPPSVSVGESDYILLVIVGQGNASLTDMVNANGEPKELGFGPYMGAERYPLVIMLSVESRD